ncbi:hypothetical protein C8R45DRAFT_940864 [Mycena sanguinolenta]|nr:hypothetical protein C8R45DRAFT_940864 [Mycena sanguinolenta]
MNTSGETHTCLLTTRIHGSESRRANCELGSDSTEPTAAARRRFAMASVIRLTVSSEEQSESLVSLQLYHMRRTWLEQRLATQRARAERMNRPAPPRSTRHWGTQLHQDDEDVKRCISLPQSRGFHVSREFHAEHEPRADQEKATRSEGLFRINKCNLDLGPVKPFAYRKERRRVYIIIEVRCDVLQVRSCKATWVSGKNHHTSLLLENRLEVPRSPLRLSRHGVWPPSVEIRVLCSGSGATQGIASSMKGKYSDRQQTTKKNSSIGPRRLKLATEDANGEAEAVARVAQGVDANEPTTTQTGAETLTLKRSNEGIQSSISWNRRTPRRIMVERKSNSVTAIQWKVAKDKGPVRATQKPKIKMQDAHRNPNALLPANCIMSAAVRGASSIPRAIIWIARGRRRASTPVNGLTDGNADGLATA